jgi:hypothetical protein
MGDIAQLYFSFRKSKKPLPKSAKDLAPYQNGYPGVEKAVKGDIIIQWGAGLSNGPDAANTVLAYEKAAPEHGGAVLTQDGEVRTMTPEQFKAAPKAGSA